VHTKNASVEIRNSTVVALSDRQRLERDLHDGVQNELVSLLVKVGLARDDAKTPPAIVRLLAELESHAQTALDSVRNIARGICPPRLADFGLCEALRAQAMRLPIRVRLIGGAPRSHGQVEEAVFFSCSEAIQNAAKHAGRAARVTLRLDHHQGTLRVVIADDGRGFDPGRARRGAGLQNIRDRIEAHGGSFRIASEPRFGTVVTLSLPWPAAAEGAR
jgi:signal transduction histidine kinase